MKRYEERCLDRKREMAHALDRLVNVCRAEAEVREAYVFGSYAQGTVGPTSDLDILIVRETNRRNVDRAADIAFAARGAVPFDFVVVTPTEFADTLPTTSFGRTILATAKRIYAT